MLEALPNPLQVGLAIFLFGGWVLLFWIVRMLFTGKLCTGRELEEKNKTILVLEQSNKELIKQQEESLRAFLRASERTQL